MPEEKKGVIAKLEPGSVDENSLSGYGFPTEAFERTKPSDADQVLTLKTGWSLTIDDDLIVTNNLTVSNDATFSGDVDIAGVITGSPMYYEAISTTQTLTSTAANQFYDCTAGTNGIRITLMASSASMKGMTITFEKADNVTPLVTIIPSGSETASGMSYIHLLYRHQKVTITNNGTGWYITGGSLIVDSGWINTADWSNRHLGCMEVPYDGAVGTFLVGEKLTQVSPAVTWNIVKVAAATLTCWNATGTGFATNDADLVGSQSGATAKVNTATTTKNLDSNFYHGFSTAITNLVTHVFFSNDKGEGTCREVLGVSGAATQGFVTRGVTTYNDIAVQTEANRIYNLDDSGALETWDTEDYYYRIVVKAFF